MFSKIRSLPIALLCILQLQCGGASAANADYDRGVYAYQTRDYRNAIVKFASAQKSGFQVSSCMYYQALCWQNLGQTANAKQTYSEILRLYPNTPAAEQAKVALTGLGVQAPPAATVGSAAPALNENDWYLGYKPIAEIPFVNTDEGMVVTAIINGRPVPCMWDTGAAGMHFDKSQLVKCGVDLSSARKAGIAAGIGGAVQSYEFDAKVALGREVQNIPVSFVDDDVSSKNGQQSISEYGLIGEEFFGRYAYEVDPATSRIRLLKRTNVDVFRPKHQFSIRSNPYSKLGEPFRWEDAHIYVTTKVNGRECEMIFDTGAGSIAFTDKQLIGIGMTLPTNSGAGRSFGVGGSRASYWFKLGTIEFGPSTSNNVDASVVVHGSHPAPLLGQSYLKHLRYIIDPELQIIRIGKP